MPSSNPYAQFAPHAPRPYVGQHADQHVTFATAGPRYWTPAPLTYYPATAAPGAEPTSSTALIIGLAALAVAILIVGVRR